MSTTKLIRRYLLSAGAGLLLVLGAPTNAAASPAEETAVLAGGCFWGVDAVFKHVRGVTDVVSGYSGGGASTAHYGQVSTGETGHAESVRVRFDPAQISYRQLLKIFFGVAHNPTQSFRQGPDIGSQYRSVIFYNGAEQRKVAESLIKQLNAERAFSSPIVTQVVPLQQFYPAEEHHQNYLASHAHQPYIVYNDLPKLKELQRQFPEFYR